MENADELSERVPAVTLSGAIRTLLIRAVEDEPIVLLDDGAASTCIVHVGDDAQTVAVLVTRHVLDTEEVILILQEELRLSPQQAVIAVDLVRGISRSAIADRLGVTIHTVRRHSEAIYARLAVRSSVELEKYVVRAVESRLVFSLDSVP